MARIRSKMLFIPPVTNLDIDEAKCYDGYLDLAVFIPPLSILNIDPLATKQYIDTPIHDHDQPLTLITHHLRHEIHLIRKQEPETRSNVTIDIDDNV